MFAFRPTLCGMERKLVRIQYSSRCCVCRSLPLEQAQSFGASRRRHDGKAKVCRGTPQCISQKTGDKENVPGREGQGAGIHLIHAKSGAWQTSVCCASFHLSGAARSRCLFLLRQQFVCFKTQLSVPGLCQRFGILPPKALKRSFP